MYGIELLKTINTRKHGLINISSVFCQSCSCILSILLSSTNNMVEAYPLKINEVRLNLKILNTSYSVLP